MWCTSGCAPVAMDVRHTGVREGNVVTPRRYSPASASSDSVGAERWPTAFSNIDGVRPSITIRMLLLGKRAQAGVFLPGPLACAQRECRNRDRLEETDDRDQCERERDDGRADEQDGGSRRRPPAPHGPPHEDART